METPIDRKICFWSNVTLFIDGKGGDPQIVDDFILSVRVETRR